MIMTVAEAKQFVTTSDSDQVLEAKLQALELLIRRYTNNNFQSRAYRKNADIMGSSFFMEGNNPFKVGDTVQVSESAYNEGLFVVKTVNDSSFTVDEETVNEIDVLLTKVVYPMDVKMGVVNMLKWDLDNRDKVGIQSETISRHSVTYFNMDGDNSTIGYPKSLIGFLKPYIKARF